MKTSTVTIEKVSNGWIVRPFTPGKCDWAEQDIPDVWVFKTVEELCSELPKLLESVMRNP